MSMAYWSFGGWSNHLPRRKAGTDDTEGTEPREVPELNTTRVSHLSIDVDIAPATAAIPISIKSENCGGSTKYVPEPTA